MRNVISSIISIPFFYRMIKPTIYSLMIFVGFGFFTSIWLISCKPSVESETLSQPHEAADRTKATSTIPENIELKVLGKYDTDFGIMYVYLRGEDTIYVSQCGHGLSMIIK
jgi:hypothetical protein